MIHQAAYEAGIQNIRLHRPSLYYGRRFDPSPGAMPPSPLDFYGGPGFKCKWVLPATVAEKAGKSRSYDHIYFMK